MKKCKVAYHVSSIYLIPDEFYRQSGIKTLVVDLDNTLDSAYTNEPRKEAYELRDRLCKLGIQFLVVSNNHLKRVKPYCDKLGVEYLADSNKYFKGKILKWLNSKNVDIAKTLFVGDQIFTDRIYVNKLHGRLILTEPLVKKDQFFTRFVRWYDKILRAKWLKNGQLGLEIKTHKGEC
jgi:HAD superfamily phosphatase (TIGR01668 family)